MERFKYHPTKRAINIPPPGNIIFAVTKSRKSKHPNPKRVYSDHIPNDQEEATPVITQKDVTNIAPHLRVTPNFSFKKAVTTSCMDIVEVKAAKANKRFSNFVSFSFNALKC